MTFDVRFRDNTRLRCCPKPQSSYTQEHRAHKNRGSTCCRTSRCSARFGGILIRHPVAKHLRPFSPSQDHQSQLLLRCFEGGRRIFGIVGITDCPGECAVGYVGCVEGYTVVRMFNWRGRGSVYLRYATVKYPSGPKAELQASMKLGPVGTKSPELQSSVA